MQRPCLKSPIIGGLVALVILLSGCGAVRLGYNMAPELSQIWLDRHVDFDGPQSEQVREHLGAFFQWHRATQLPDYAQFLAHLQTEAKNDTTPARVCHLYGDALGRLGPAIEQALPMAAQTALTLTPQQLQRLERQHEKANATFRGEYLQAVPGDRLKASLKRAVKRAESVYGDLALAQKERLARDIAASPFDPEAALAERIRRQQESVETLRRLLAEHPSAERAQAALRALADHVRVSPEPGYRAYQERLRQHQCAVVAQLHNSASPAQRLKAMARLKGWEDDFRALAASPRG